MGYTGLTFVCTFTPKVQALDNWGWCGGKCVRKYKSNGTPDLTTIGDGCYQDFVYSAGVNIYQCDKNENKAGEDPWVKYKGKIIVVPK